jgi:hypothetical protein
MTLYLIIACGSGFFVGFFVFGWILSILFKEKKKSIQESIGCGLGW